MRATDLAQLLMRRTIDTGCWAIDATVGNGHDTLFLADLVGETGRVFGFDVQISALTAAARRTHDRPQVTYFHAGHEHLSEYLPKKEPSTGITKLKGVMFNLGYLPGGSKAITTRAETTIAGLGQALARLEIGGLVTLVLYPGHPEGAEESAAVRAHVERLTRDFAVTRYSRINALRPPPELLAIERLH